MEQGGAYVNSIYEEIGKRTDGNIYLAVVGPVRTGKSTFAKRFMEQLVIPSIDNVYHRERARDELPQSGSGKTITIQDTIELSRLAEGMFFQTAVQCSSPAGSCPVRRCAFSPSNYAPAPIDTGSLRE